MTRTRSFRPVRLLLAGLLAAGAVALPATGAQAATASFNVSVTGGSQALGKASGTVSGSGSTATYSVQLCGQNTYPSSSVTIKAGSATRTHSVSYSNCQTFTGSLSSSYAISTATITVKGSTFYPGNTYTTFSRDTTVYVAAPSNPTPPSTTPTTQSFSTTARGGQNNAYTLATASGTVTAQRGGTSGSYSVRLCGGQHNYPNATVTIKAGSATRSHSVSYSNCQTFTGTLSSSSAFSTATVTVQGGTFYPGNTYQTATDTSTVRF